MDKLWASIDNTECNQGCSLANGRQEANHGGEVEAAKGRGQTQWALELLSPDKLCDY